GGHRRAPNTVCGTPDKTDPLWKAIINDDPYPPEQPDPTIVDGKPLDIPPSAIQVRTLNGTGVEGAATKAQEKLQNKGYQVVGVTNAESSDFLSTVVRYDPNYA